MIRSIRSFRMRHKILQRHNVMQTPIPSLIVRTITGSTTSWQSISLLRCRDADRIGVFRLPFVHFCGYFFRFPKDVLARVFIESPSDRLRLLGCCFYCGGGKLTAAPKNTLRIVHQQHRQKGNRAEFRHFLSLLSFLLLQLVSMLFLLLQANQMVHFPAD